MRIKTMHIQGFNDSGPICGAAGRVWSGPNWNDTDNDPEFKRCARCERKLGEGGLERLEQAREKLATARAAHRAGKDDAEKNAPSRVSSYPVGSVEAGQYARGYDAGAIEQLPPKPAIRTVSPGDAEFLMTLEAAKSRAHDYSNKERATITRAINRANRSLANPPEPCNRSSGLITERKGFHGPIIHEFTATYTLPAGHSGCHEDENKRTAVSRPFSWGNPVRRAGTGD